MEVTKVKVCKAAAAGPGLMRDKVRRINLICRSVLMAYIYV